MLTQFQLQHSLLTLHMEAIQSRYFKRELWSGQLSFSAPILLCLARTLGPGQSFLVDLFRSTLLFPATSCVTRRSFTDSLFTGPITPCLLSSFWTACLMIALISMSASTPFVLTPLTGSIEVSLTINWTRRAIIKANLNTSTFIETSFHWCLFKLWSKRWDGL